MKASLSQLFITVFVLGLSEAQNCSNSKYTSVFDNGEFNATGSITVPGPMIDESAPATTWTWSSYVGAEYDSNRNVSATWTTVGLKTSPVQNLTDPDTPYTGCVISVMGLKASVLSRDHSNDNGSCNTVFTDQCARAMIDNTRSNALALGSGSAQANTPRRDRCTGLLTQPSLTGDGDPCDGEFSIVFSSTFISSNISELRSVQPGCPVPNPGDSTAESRAFVSFRDSAGGKGNNSAYDEAVLNPLMLISVIWRNNTEGQGESVPPESLVNVNLMCIPRNITSPGSRNLSQAKAASGAVSNTGSSFAMLGSVAIGLLFGFVL